MPIINLGTDIAAVEWNVGILKTDKRSTYESKTELKIIPSVYPFAVRLNEKPYQVAGIKIPGYVEILVMPTSALEFYSSYEDSTIYFYSDQAGKLVSISYTGMGSVVAASDVNRFANFLCSMKDFLTSFLVEPLDPVAASVNITSGYINTGTSLVKIADKILKFGTGQEYEVPAMSAFFWRKLLISVNISTEEIIVTEGAEASTQAATVIPSVSANCKPCAVVTIQDNGNGGAGTIRTISLSNIEDARAIIA